MLIESQKYYWEDTSGLLTYCGIKSTPDPIRRTALPLFKLIKSLHYKSCTFKSTL